MALTNEGGDDMKLCFSTLGCSDYPLEASLSLARSYNISAIELRGIGGIMNIAEIPEFFTENAEATKSVFKKYGISPLVLGSSCRLHDKKTHAEARAAVEIASRLGIPYVRVFGNSLSPDPETATRTVIDAQSSLCPFAAERNVTLLLEVHGDFCNEKTLSPIVDAAESLSGFGLIWDIAHSDRDYGDAWREFYGFAKPYIRHVHIKDLRRHDRALTLPGDGDLPISDIVRHMLADGYTGAFSLEWEKKWHPELPDIETALERFCRISEEL